MILKSNSHFLSVFIVILLVFWGRTPSNAQQFYLDQTFGKGGSDTLNIRNTLNILGLIKKTTDGNFIVSATVGYLPTPRIALLKYKSNGTLDSSFGKNGILDTIFGQYASTIRDFRILSNNKIVLIGNYSKDPNYTSSGLLVARINSNGTIDNSFGTNGMANIPISSGFPYGYCLELNPDSSIIIGGTISFSGQRDFLLAKVSKSGLIDNSFGSNGLVIRDETYGDDIYSLAISTAGNIYAGSDLKYLGSRYYQAVLKYTSAGQPDNFGTNGIVQWPMSSSDAFTNAITITPTNQLLVGGVASNGSKGDYTLAKLNTDGTFVNSFGNSGTALIPMTSMNNNISLQGITVLPSGNLLIVGGGSTVSGFKTSIISKFTPSGSLITSFGNNGILSFNPSADNFNATTYPYGMYNASVALDPDTNNLFAVSAVWNSNKYDMGFFKFTTNSSTGLNTSTTPSVNLSNGLVATYPFNGNANDESGNGYNGTVVGANLTSDRFGNLNKAYYFDGSSSNQNYIIAPAPYNSKVFTVSFWMKPDLDILNGENPVTFSFKDDLISLYNSPFVSFFVGTTNPINDIGKYSACSYTPTNVQTCLLSSIKPTLNSWHHVVHTFDENDKMTTYMDGNLISSNSINGADQKNYKYLFMGRESLIVGSEVTKFKGVLDDYRIYSRVINTNEIKALYGDNLINLNNGLVATYPFNGNANDESGNNLNGTITGIVPFVNDRFGNANKAVQFNGNFSNYISVPHNDLFNFTSTTSFSISVWINCATTNNHFIMVSKGRDVHSGYNSYGISSDGFYISESLGQGLNTTNTAFYGSIKNPQWNHIVCIANSASQKMYYYLNGDLVKDTSYTPIDINNPYPLVFGRHFVYPDGSGGAEYPLNGYLDDISIYNRALNQNEIKALYGDTLINLTRGIIATYPFNGNANDESGNGNHGSVFGATLTNDRFGNANKAYSFNGINNYIEVKDTALLRPSIISISLWAKISQKAVYQLIYKGKWNDASSEAYSINYLEGSTLNYPTFAIKSGSNCVAANGWKIASNYADLIDLNTWHHVVATFDGTTQKVYLDNVQVSSNNYTGTMDNCKGSNLNFGRSWASLPYYLKGELDDISLYNRALHPNEIKALYNSIPIQNPSINCSTTTITNFVIPSPTHTITSLNTVTVTKTVFHTITVPTLIIINPVNQGGRENENDISASFNYQTNFITVTSPSNSVYNVEIIDTGGTSLSVHYNLSSISINKLPKGNYLLKAKGFDGSVLKLFRLSIE